jgi:hypothetical protein
MSSLPPMSRDAGDRAQKLRMQVAITPPLTFFLGGGWLLAGVGELMPMPMPVAVVGVIASPWLSWKIAGRMHWLIGRTAEGFVTTLTAQGGDPVPRGFSAEEAMVMRGDITSAIAAYEQILHDEPLEVEAALRLADLYARPDGDLVAAERVLQEARGREPTRAQETRIGNALIDLYRATNQRGPLKEELARFARLHHGSRAGEAARRMLRELVAEDHQE